MDKNTYSLQNTQNIKDNEKINMAPYFTAQGYGPKQLKILLIQLRNIHIGC